jgi:hypothetical protein
MSHTCLAVIASGKGFIRLAQRWQKSACKYHPDICRVLITDDPHDVAGFSETFIVCSPTHEHFSGDKPRYMRDYLHNTDADNVCFFDADTYICDKLDNVFWMFEHSSVDVMGVVSPRRCVHTPTLQDLPDTFPEMNTGVLFVSNNYRTRMLFDLWVDLYDKHYSAYHSDQIPFRHAMWLTKEDINYQLIPVEYNFRFGFGGQLKGKVKVLHGRTQDMEAVERQVNEEHGMFRSFRRGDVR